MHDDQTTEVIGARRAWIEERRDAGPNRGRRNGPVLAEHAAGWTDRTAASRTLHRLGELTARPIAGVVVAAAVVVWAGVGLATEFPHWWEVGLYATSTSITLVMVFAIQHTQARQEMAIQRKLDELLRAMPAADDGLIAAEDAPDDELNALAALNRADREHRGPAAGHGRT
ncbi:MAG TPA: low affinity iron permease family protein [Acidimicrobiales bacterium]